MKLDSPERGAPSTPPQSEALNYPPTEPHSSKVTINLRNVNSIEATPTSQPSPTRIRSRHDDVKISIEESEVDIGPALPTTDDVPSPASDVNSSDLPVIAVGDYVDDDPELVQGRSPVLMAGTFGNIDMNSILMAFPYHAPEETYSETVARLVQFFQQRKSQTSNQLEPVVVTSATAAQFEDALFQMKAWIEKYLSYVGSAYSPQDLLESALENRIFWKSLTELCWTIYLRR
jgi:ubiquitin carboxyl-terminal hydrolase 34